MLFRSLIQRLANGIRPSGYLLCYQRHTHRGQEKRGHPGYQVCLPHDSVSKLHLQLDPGFYLATAAPGRVAVLEPAGGVAGALVVKKVVMVHEPLTVVLGRTG